MKNITYSGNELAEYYASNRNTWETIYDSEKRAFEHAASAERSLGHVLDVGCGAGGLFPALSSQFTLSSYTGVDIHNGAIDWAKNTYAQNPKASFTAGDILTTTDLPRETYDTVLSLSCADWNLETNAIMQRCWDHVAPGGTLIITLRLTNEQTIRDFQQSYQYIFFGNELPKDTSTLEKAPYVILNWQLALQELTQLPSSPDHIYAYGYWGPPSSTAVTPYSQLVFTAFAVHKPKNKTLGTATTLHLPVNLLI